METRAHYVAVGAFVLALVFLGFVGVLWIGGTQFTSNNVYYDIFFKGPVSGLSKGAAVDYNGIPVGHVSDIEIDPNNVEQIRVTVEIKKEIVIKENAAANVESNILSGVSTILITRGTQDAKPLEAHKGERYPVIRARRSTLASLSARGPQLMEKVETILDHLDDVLSDDNRQAFGAILGNVKKVTGALADHSDDFGQVAVNASEALKSISGFVTNVNKSYSDPDGLKDRLRAGLAEFSTALGDLDKLSKGVNVVVQDARPGLRTFSQHTLADIDGLVGEVRQLVSGLSRFAGQLERDPTRLLFGDRREGYKPK
jgi:phospholipid/cholesterol/gamma-HCH transport system substrate-binding protein